MKRLVFALMLFALGANAQEYITVTPVIGSAAVAGCILKTGSDTIAAATSVLASVDTGQAIYGVGIPYGTVVTGVNGADTVIMSNAATQGGTKVLNFGYLDPDLETYETGAWLGLPFRVYSRTGQGGAVNLVTAVVLDNSDVLDSLDIVFFSAYSDTLGQDTAVAAVLAPDAFKVLGAISLNSVTDFGGARESQATNINMILPRETLYARLIARGEMIVAAVNSFRVKLGFK